jgi:DNA modification methylase
MMKEFVSKLEDLMPAEELLFEPTPAFGRYKPFLEHAVAHPAKANTKLLEFLVRTFTEPGDVVLDPMAGSGSTGVVAALHGRNAVQVELEAKFYDWMEKARENVEKHFTLAPKGRIVNICGDARRLSELLCRADVAITSPPHGDTYLGGGDPEKRKERLIKAGHDPKEFLGGRARNAVLKHYDEVDVCITSPPYSDAISQQGGPTDVRNVGISTITAREYSQNPENIGNLSLGEISTIITSPPYLNVDNVEPKSEGFWRKTHDEGKRWGSRPPSGTEEKQIMADGNIGNLPLGNVDAVITSPPYADAKKGGEADREQMAEKWDEAFKEKGETWNSWGKTWHTPGRLRGLEALGSGYSKSEQNIGNLPLGEISAVITSPPYEGSLEGTTRHTRGGIASRDPALAQTGTYATTLSEATKQGVPIGYSPNPENIGNLKRETYLEAMLKVYSEMWKVLKPNGLAIIIVKPFIRNKKVVDLPWHTWLLMAKAGFKLEKLYKLRLKSQSFWRILYARKFPDAERISHEYIIVARKPGEMD